MRRLEALPTSLKKEVLLQIKKNPLALFSCFFLMILFLFTIIGPVLSSYTYEQIHLAASNHPPSSQFWFGTDDLGRDLFTRIWWGARISLCIGLFAALLDFFIGVPYGIVSGYLGGKVDEFMMRFCDILYAIPPLLILILLTLLLGKGLSTILAALILTSWINMARICRGQTLQLKHKDFVCAAYCLGASPFQILKNHILPSLRGTILATLTLTIPQAIFLEAFLSFLGLGIHPPLASWGIMVSDGLSTIHFFPWRIFFPSFFISMTMLSLNLLGNTIRDALDPRLSP